MFTTDFCRGIRRRWHTAARMFWPESRGDRLRSRRERLDRELRRRFTRLLVLRRKIEKLRDAPALCDADRLVRLERAYAARLFRFQERMRQRRELDDAFGRLKRLRSPAPNESDFDYPF